MKRLIFLSIFMILTSGLNAGIGKYYNNLNSGENPNGEPFLISLGIENNIHSFKYYDESTFYVTLPISNILTIKYRENVQYQDDVIILKSEHDMIESLDKHYTLEFHLPLYKFWKK